MKLWKVLGFVFGLYGLIGPWLIGAGAAGSHTGGPSWLILFAPTYKTIKPFITIGEGLITGITTYIIIVGLLTLLNALIWFLAGVVLGLAIQRTKEMIR